MFERFHVFLSLVILPKAVRILSGVRGYWLIFLPTALDTAMRIALGPGAVDISPTPTAL